MIVNHRPVAAITKKKKANDTDDPESESIELACVFGNNVRA